MLLLFFFQIELLTLVFLNTLAEEAKAKAFEEKSATIRAQHLKTVSKVGLNTSLIVLGHESQNHSVFLSVAHTFT